MKIYWPILKISLNNKNVPCLHQQNFFNNFKEKAGLLNIFFAEPFSLVSNEPLNLVASYPS